MKKNNKNNREKNNKNNREKNNKNNRENNNKNNRENNNKKQKESVLAQLILPKKLNQYIKTYQALKGISVKKDAIIQIIEEHAASNKNITL